MNRNKTVKSIYDFSIELNAQEVSKLFDKTYKYDQTPPDYWYAMFVADQAKELLLLGDASEKAEDYEVINITIEQPVVNGEVDKLIVTGRLQKIVPIKLTSYEKESLRRVMNRMTEAGILDVNPMVQVLRKIVGPDPVVRNNSRNRRKDIYK